MSIQFFDMFAGIGGFRSGLEAVGGFECIGHCEIDRYANLAYNAIYEPKGEVYYEDARTIDPATLPDIDLICGGFPCQSFSIAGKRRGFEDDTRGTLFFEIARIAAVKRPAFLLLENVPGLLSHDQGRSFETILRALDELGYDVAWQVLNSKDFGVPQSRNRVYIIGYLRERCAGEILSVTGANGTPVIQILPGSQGNRVYSDQGVSITLTSGAGGFGGKCGLYHVDMGLPIKVLTKTGFQMAYPGDSIDLAYPTMNTRRGRVGTDVAHTITASNTQGYYFIDMNEDARLTDHARCITAKQDAGLGHHKGERSGVLVETGPEMPNSQQTAIHTGEPKFTLAVRDQNGIMRYGRVRKLTPRECWRLQGFTDEQFNKAAAEGLSDGRLYKMAGNAVSVPVISALGEIIKRIYNEGRDTP